MVGRSDGRTVAWSDKSMVGLSASSASSSSPPPRHVTALVKKGQKKPSWTAVLAKLKFRSVAGKRVASVPSLFSIMERESNHIGEKISTGKRRHSWSDAQVFKAPRCGDKKGGSDEWVAVASVLEKLHEEAK